MSESPDNLSGLFTVDEPGWLGHVLWLSLIYLGGVFTVRLAGATYAKITLRARD